MKRDKSLFLRMAEFYGDNAINAISDKRIPEWRVKKEAMLAASYALAEMVRREKYPDWTPD